MCIQSTSGRWFTLRGWIITLACLHRLVSAVCFNVSCSNAHSADCLHNIKLTIYFRKNTYQETFTLGYRVKYICGDVNMSKINKYFVFQLYPIHTCATVVLCVI